jgi:hypothetical protein
MLVSFGFNFLFCFFFLFCLSLTVFVFLLLFGHAITLKKRELRGCLGFWCCCLSSQFLWRTLIWVGQLTENYVSMVKHKLADFIYIVRVRSQVWGRRSLSISQPLDKKGLTCRSSAPLQKVLTLLWELVEVSE